MTDFNFYHPIEVRWADLDAWRHVNNARYVTFIEQARVAYMMKTGIWDGVTFTGKGFVVADVHIAYLAPIFPAANVRVGVRTVQIGNKSIKFEEQVENIEDGQIHARADVISVGFDFDTQVSYRIPDETRTRIAAFEGWETTS